MMMLMIIFMFKVGSCIVDDNYDDRDKPVSDAVDDD